MPSARTGSVFLLTFSVTNRISSCSMTSSIGQQIVVRPRDDRERVVEKRHALVEQALDLRHAVAIFKRLHQVANGHLEIQSPLHADGCVRADVPACLVDLLLQDALVENRHNHVIEVESHAGVVQDPDDVGQVIQLVLAEEFVVQVEGAEHHVHLRHVVVVLRVERVVEAGQFRPRRVDEPEIVEAAGAVNVRQQLLKELQVALTVEDHHGDLVTVLRWSHSPHQILGDDVLEQRRLAAAGHSQHDALHHADLIGPQPGISMNVVPEHDPALVPCRCRPSFRHEPGLMTSGGWTFRFSRRDRRVA